MLQQPETNVRVNRELGQRAYGGSWLERKMLWALERLGLKPERQFAIPRSARDTLGRQRYWFVDFAFPSLKIAIECDGEPWHVDKERDARRQADIELYGWTVLRFTGTEVKEDLLGCADRVARVANNHAHGFTFGSFVVKKIEVVPRKYHYETYNLSVDVDESYIAKGIVVHNCRCTEGISELR